MLKQEQLAKIIFPLGKYTKDKIKKIAKELNLKVHEKKESQDFYSGDYEELLDTMPDKGYILDKTGKVLGKHKGICFYTIGQRKGLGISHSEPLYVIEIKKDNNTVVVGEENDLYKKKMIVSNLNWISIDSLTSPLETKARIRYLHKEAEALVTLHDNNSVKVSFKEPQRAIAPGQFAVFYDNDIVVGGGIIE